MVQRTHFVHLQIALVDRVKIAMNGLPELNDMNALSMDDYTVWFKTRLLCLTEDDLELGTKGGTGPDLEMHL